MNTATISTPRRLLALGSALAVAATLVGSSVALATPAGGSAASSVLADGTTMNAINTNINDIKLRTHGSVEVLQLTTTGQPGFSSGWHRHSGPVLVNVTAGALTVYTEDDCSPLVVTAGHGFIEDPGASLLARNEGAVAATWLTTQIIPVAGARRIDETPGHCGVG